LITGIETKKTFPRTGFYEKNNGGKSGEEETGEIGGGEEVF